METMPQTSLDVVHAFFAAMTTLDYDTGLSYVSADCEYDNVPLPAFKVHGPDEVRAVLEPFFAPSLENEFVIQREAATGPVVFIERLDRHRLESGWIELPASGVFEVHDGLITLWRDYFDLATIQPMLDAAGLAF